jgi:hypothetical protein
MTMTPQRRLVATLFLLLANPWAAAHPGHGQGLGHVHASWAQALSEGPVALAAALVAVGGLAAWWGWRQHQAQQRRAQAVARCTRAAASADPSAGAGAVGEPARD